MNNKEKIIEIALKLFVENGFHGTATAKIANEAGVANGTLFNYFKTKDELVIALYVLVKEELADKIALKFNKNQEVGIKEIIKIQFIETLLWAIENPLKFKYIQQFQTSPYLVQVKQKVIDNQVVNHLEIIQKGINQKKLKEIPSDLILTLISSQAFGIYDYLMANKKTKKQQLETITQTFNLLWEMIKF